MSEPSPDGMIDFLTKSLMDVITPDILQEISARIFKYNLHLDQHGNSRVEDIVGEVKSETDAIDKLYDFYSAVLVKDDPGAYMLYDDGSGVFIVAKCVEDLL